MLDKIYCWHQDTLMRVLLSYSKEYSCSQKYTHETETTRAINHEQTVKGEMLFYSAVQKKSGCFSKNNLNEAGVITLITVINEWKSMTSYGLRSQIRQWCKLRNPKMSFILMLLDQRSHLWSRSLCCFCRFHLSLTCPAGWVSVGSCWCPAGFFTFRAELEQRLVPIAETPERWGRSQDCVSLCQKSSPPCWKQGWWHHRFNAVCVKMTFFFFPPRFYIYGVPASLNIF